MASSDRTEDGTTNAAVAGSIALAPAGTHAIAVHSDLRCPCAHVAVHRLLEAAARRGVEREVCLDHRWFPLDESALPAGGEDLDRMLAPIRALAPDAGWATWADSDARPPRSTRVAAAWVQAAKAQSPAASIALDRALRRALFADRQPLDDPAVVARIAADVDLLDAEAASAEVDSGRPDAELDRHADAAASDAVPASPTLVLADGTRWTNPGIQLHHEDGTPVIDVDDADVYDEIVERFLALRQFD